MNEEERIQAESLLFMDDLKLFSKSEEQMESVLRNTCEHCLCL